MRNQIPIFPRQSIVMRLPVSVGTGGWLWGLVRGVQGFRVTIWRLMIVLSDPAKDVWIFLDFWWTSLGWNGFPLDPQQWWPVEEGRTPCVGFLLTYAEGILWPVRAQLTLSTLVISYALLVMASLLSLVESPAHENLKACRGADQNTSAFWSPSDFCYWKPKEREVLFQI